MTFSAFSNDAESPKDSVNSLIVSKECLTGDIVLCQAYACFTVFSLHDMRRTQGSRGQVSEIRVSQLAEGRPLHCVLWLIKAPTVPQHFAT